MAMNGRFEMAAVGIFCSMVLDSLDGRVARLMELDGRYVDVILRRWAEFTGKDPVLESTGQTFAEVQG